MLLASQEIKPTSFFSFSPFISAAARSTTSASSIHGLSCFRVRKLLVKDEGTDPHCIECSLLILWGSQREKREREIWIRNRKLAKGRRTATLLQVRCLIFDISPTIVLDPPL